MDVVVGQPAADLRLDRCGICAGGQPHQDVGGLAAQEVGLQRLDEVEVDDCRWTPCFDCGVCDQMGTEIQVGPTGVAFVPVPVLPDRVSDSA